MLREGWLSILGPQADGLDIRTNQLVSAVDVVPREATDRDGGGCGEFAVRVRTTGGATYLARRAVVTLPLGVLKACGAP